MWGPLEWGKEAVLGRKRSRLHPMKLAVGNAPCLMRVCLPGIKMSGIHPYINYRTYYVLSVPI
jgi:hypothetical protein